MRVSPATLKFPSSVAEAPHHTTHTMDDETKQFHEAERTLNEFFQRHHIALMRDLPAGGDQVVYFGEGCVASEKETQQRLRIMILLDRSRRVTLVKASPADLSLQSMERSQWDTLSATMHTLNCGHVFTCWELDAVHRTCSVRSSSPWPLHLDHIDCMWKAVHAAIRHDVPRIIQMPGVSSVTEEADETPSAETG
jgi:hypothetical protein